MTDCQSSFLNKRSAFSVLGAAGALLLGLSSPAMGANAKAQDHPAPSAEERAELAKFPAYTGNIEVISSNEGNGLERFLADNTGKTVFIETTVLKYFPAPENVTGENRDLIPPTDRFENPVFNKCWGKEANHDGLIYVGDQGFPLPLSAADIEAGCSTRIKIELANGDYGPNVDFAGGFDKKEIYFIGFFEVKKETLENGKTLYRLTENSVEEPTMLAFYAYARKLDRGIRELSVEEDQGKDQVK